jgi:hypothetical protein
MPSNNTGRVVKQLFKDHPGKIALLLNPDCLRPHHFEYMYAIDNAAFKQFNERKFFKMLSAAPKENPPLFVVCPDVVGCHDRTIALWHYYYPKIKPYGFPIAFVAQDGCTPDAIPAECDWIFIGGTTQWKMNNIKPYIGLRPVHVGRVNAMHFVKYCESLGVTSIDGTGWMRARDKKYYDFMHYFNGEVQLGLPTN